MKRFFLIAWPLILAACAAPKHQYYFSYYKPSAAIPHEEISKVDQPLDIGQLTAGLESAPYIAPEVNQPEAQKPSSVNKNITSEKTLTGESFNNLSHADKKYVKHELKKLIKKKKAAKESWVGPAETKAMDHDLKLAIIFGAVGLTLSLFTGVNAAFGVIGVIAIVIGVVFLVRWLIRQ